MKKIIYFLMSGTLALTTSALAADADSNRCANILPQVTLQLSAEQWVTTQTADVSITMDALLNKDQVAQAQSNFQLALKKIASEGNWHITEFTRTTGKTDLEQIHAVAQARLSESALAGLRSRTKSLNSEGISFSVQEIVYSPTAEEISSTQAKLRSQIYNQAKAELDRLNGAFPKPGYSLYYVNFVNLNIQPGPMVKMAEISGGMPREAPAASLSQKLTQDAVVILASSPGQLCK